MYSECKSSHYTCRVSFLTPEAHNQYWQFSTHGRYLLSLARNCSEYFNWPSVCLSVCQGCDAFPIWGRLSACIVSATVTLPHFHVQCILMSMQLPHGLWRFVNWLLGRGRDALWCLSLTLPCQVSYVRIMQKRTTWNGVVVSVETYRDHWNY